MLKHSSIRPGPTTNYLQIKGITAWVDTTNTNACNLKCCTVHLVLLLCKGRGYDGSGALGAAAGGQVRALEQAESL